MSRVALKVLWICGVLKHAFMAQQLFPSRDRIFTPNPSPWQSGGYLELKGSLIQFLTDLSYTVRFSLSEQRKK